MRITIEINGQVLDITGDCIDPDNVFLSLPRDIETLADGTKRVTGTGRLSLEANLVRMPLWREA